MGDDPLTAQTTNPRPRRRHARVPETSFTAVRKTATGTLVSQKPLTFAFRKRSRISDFRPLDLLSQKDLLGLSGFPNAILGPFGVFRG